MKNTRLILLSLACALSVLTGCWFEPEVAEDKYARPSITAKPKKEVQVGAYFVPRSHQDEMDIYAKIATGQSFFPGHFQPKRPLVTKIGRNADIQRHSETASKYGIDAFIMDWKCNKEGPYDNDLIDGIMSRKVRINIRYALIWRNDDADNQGERIANGGSFREAIDDLVDEHFTRKSYWKVEEGKPYFSIYDLKHFVSAFENMELAKRSLRMLRNRTSAAGPPGLHLNGTTFGLSPEEVETYREGLELDSITDYNWAHTGLLTERPGTDYTQVSEGYFNKISSTEGVYPSNYVVNVSMGWDPVLQWEKGVDWKNETAYPYGPIMVGNNPGRFTKALDLAKAQAVECGHNFVLLHAWNDWMNGSFIEQEEMYRASYLEGINHVFIVQQNVNLKALNRWRSMNR